MDAFEAMGMHTRRQCAPEPLLGHLKCWGVNKVEGVYRPGVSESVLLLRRWLWWWEGGQGRDLIIALS